MDSTPTKDTRGYFILPQSPEGCAYYTYGTPGAGAGQYTHPALMSIIFYVESQWRCIDSRKFGIGNISLKDGVSFPKHRTHMSGLEVDARPLRKDGQDLAVTRFDAAYDADATAKLIALFWESRRVKAILFNDPSVPRVRSRPNHDNHFHVTVTA